MRVPAEIESEIALKRVGYFSSGVVGAGVFYGSFIYYAATQNIAFVFSLLLAGGVCGLVTIGLRDCIRVRLTDDGVYLDYWLRTRFVPYGRIARVDASLSGREQPEIRFADEAQWSFDQFNRFENGQRLLSALIKQVPLISHEDVSTQVAVMGGVDGCRFQRHGYTVMLTARLIGGVTNLALQTAGLLSRQALSVPVVLTAIGIGVVVSLWASREALSIKGDTLCFLRPWQWRGRRIHLNQPFEIVWRNRFKGSELFVEQESVRIPIAVGIEFRAVIERYLRLRKGLLEGIGSTHGKLTEEPASDLDEFRFRPSWLRFLLQVLVEVPIVFLIGMLVSGNVYNNAPVVIMVHGIALATLFIGVHYWVSMPVCVFTADSVRVRSFLRTRIDPARMASVDVDTEQERIVVALRGNQLPKSLVLNCARYEIPPVESAERIARFYGIPLSGVPSRLNASVQ